MLGGVVCCPVSKSIGTVIRDLGKGLNKHGEEVTLLEVRVVEKHAHHKEGDIVIWEFHEGDL